MSFPPVFFARRLVFEAPIAFLSSGNHLTITQAYQYYLHISYLKSKEKRQSGVALTTAETKEYLGIVLDMEKDLYLKRELIKYLKAELAGLGKPKALQQPWQPPAISSKPKKAGSTK